MTASSNLAFERLAGLRDILAARGLDGWYVGREDMYQGEEVPAAEERLAFIRLVRHLQRIAPVTE